jgi:hypothetical protein
MNKALFIFFVCLSSSKIIAQFPYADTAYFYLFGAAQVEEFRDVVNVSIDSGYVAVGTTSSFGYGESDIYLVKTDWKCNTLWSRHFGSVNIEKGCAVKETFDKGFIIGGYTNNTLGGDYDMFLIKVDSNGFEQWEKKFGGADWDFMYSLAIAPDSGFILCGETYSFGNNSSDVYLIHTDKNGNLIWEKNYGGANVDVGNKVIVTLDSNLIIAGYTKSFGAGMKDLYLLKCDLNGDTIFTKTFGGAFNDEAYSLVEHYTVFDSGYFCVGYTGSYNILHDKDIFLIKFDKSGNVLFNTSFGNVGGDDAATCVTNIGYDFFVSGYTANGSGVFDLAAGIVNFAGFWLFNQSSSYGGLFEDKAFANLITLRNDFLYAGSTKSFGDPNGDAFLLLADSIRPQIQKISTSSTALVGVESAKQYNYSFYPNPTTNKLYVSINDKKNLLQKIQIYNAEGKMVLQKFNSNYLSILEIETSELNAGLYFLQIINSDNILSEKFIIYR